MKILITGASGSMGYYLAKHIQSLGEGHYVVGLGRKSADQVELTGLDRYISCDMMKAKVELCNIVASWNFDIIFHLAADANVRNSFQWPEWFLNNNVIGTFNLLEGIAAAEIKPIFVHCSTSEVYGNVPQERNPITEDYPADEAVNPYAMTKVMQETLVKTYQRLHGPFGLVITRAFGYINPRRKDLVATALARQIVELEAKVSKPLDPYAVQGLPLKHEVTHGNLEPVRSFCDARDIAEAYWLAATKCGPGVYNIGSEQPCSIGKLLEQLMAISGCKASLRQLKSLVRPTDIFYCVPDTSKFYAATRWRPRRTLSESLNWLLQEVREQ